MSSAILPGDKTDSTSPSPSASVPKKENAPTAVDTVDTVEATNNDSNINKTENSNIETDSETKTKIQTETEGDAETNTDKDAAAEPIAVNNTPMNDEESNTNTNTNTNTNNHQGDEAAASQDNAAQIAPTEKNEFASPNENENNEKEAVTEPPPSKEDSKDAGPSNNNAKVDAGNDAQQAPPTKETTAGGGGATEGEEIDKTEPEKAGKANDDGGSDGDDKGVKQEVEAPQSQQPQPKSMESSMELDDDGQAKVKVKQDESNDGQVNQEHDKNNNANANDKDGKQDGSSSSSNEKDPVQEYMSIQEVEQELNESEQRDALLVATALGENSNKDGNESAPTTDDGKKMAMETETSPVNDAAATSDAGDKDNLGDSCANNDPTKDKLVKTYDGGAPTIKKEGDNNSNNSNNSNNNAKSNTTTTTTTQTNPTQPKKYPPHKLPPMEYTPLKAPTQPKKKAPVIAMGRDTRTPSQKKNVLPVNMTPIQWRQQWQQHVSSGGHPPPPHHPHHPHAHHSYHHAHGHYHPSHGPPPHAHYSHHQYYHPQQGNPNYGYYAGNGSGGGYYDHYPPHHPLDMDPRTSSSPGASSPASGKESEALEGITALAESSSTKKNDNGNNNNNKKRKKPSSSSSPSKQKEEEQGDDENGQDGQPLNMLSSASLQHSPYDNGKSNNSGHPPSFPPHPHYSYPPPPSYYYHHPMHHSPPHHHEQPPPPPGHGSATPRQSSLNGLLGAAHVVDSLNLERSNRNRSAHLNRMLNHPNRRDMPKDGQPAHISKKAKNSKGGGAGGGGSGSGSGGGSKHSKGRFPNEQVQSQAQLSTQLARQALKYPRIKKKLYLSLALVRVNPRKPFPTPPPGAILGSKFHWASFPPLDAILRDNMREYYELSTNKCQSRDQQAFNNRLVELIQEETARYGWKFDEREFDDKKIRDRIRCFYKTHIQNAKKRLNTMLKNPSKRANIKALANHFHIIEDKATLTAEEGRLVGDDDDSMGFNVASNDFSDDDLNMSGSDMMPLLHEQPPYPHPQGTPPAHPHDVAQHMLSLGASRQETV